MNKYERFEAHLGVPCLHEDGFRVRGRNSGMCFYGKGGGGSAPSPDPQIGQAALKNAQIGEEWLNFAKEQFKVGNIRQDEMDALTKSVINQQLSSSTKAEQRSDQQWNDYQSTYRPIEKMNALDALGGQYLTDDQVKSYLGNENQGQLSQLQAKRDANIAKIQAMGVGTSNQPTSTTTGGISKEDAAALAKTIAGNAPSAPNITPFSYDYDAQIAQYNSDLDAYNKKVVEISSRLSGAGSTATTTSQGLSKDEIDKLVDAENAKYNAEAAGLTNVTDQVMMQRNASKLAQENAAGEAKADVMRNADMARQVSERNMASMGLNPASGRFASMNRLNQMDTGLAAAGAENAARTNVKNQGIALRADQANYGRGGSAVAAQQAGLGMNAGNSAVGNSNTANANWRSNFGIMGQGYQGAMQGYSNQANVLSNLYGQQLSAWNAQNQANATSAAGLGSMLGTVAGAGITVY